MCITTSSVTANMRKNITGNASIFTASCDVLLCGGTAPQSGKRGFFLGDSVGAGSGAIIGNPPR